MAETAEENRTQPAGGNAQTAPIDQLTEELRNLAEAAGERLLSSVTEKIGGLTERLTDYVGGGGGDGGGGGGGLSLIGSVIGSKHPVATGLKGVAKMAVGGLFQKITGGGGGGGKGGKGKKLKITNIVETLDVGAPLRVVYNQWTQFEDFPSFMKKVEGVEQKADEKLSWKAQVFWSHRVWESTIIDQMPDRQIVWRSQGPKGWVDGAVTFHSLSPNLTRILLVLEYHPQGFFEKTGNLWRAQGRRARLEFKHFRRHVMTQTLLHPDDVEGWRGEIHESKVVKDHETALREEEEQREREEAEQGPEAEGEQEGVEPEEAEAEEPEEAEEAAEPEAEAEGEPEAAEEEPEEPEAEAEEAQEEEPEEEPEPVRRPARRRRRDVSAEEEPAEETAQEEPEEEPEPARRPARRRRRESEADTEDRPPPRPTRRRAAARST
ncbi:SRPBCC family protein [Streptosporangium carneum]|uniref:Coenzyme Q-binding protein COQ10 START domain-containing protein n=1 Tax=Streptosporangium carneum TaxID=47481 RepID=A0A9W6MAG0_9ACTN|nr:SRPBCC family protein [Streptosporangium carneum]GLK07016.1 hypothetical protein GCM10017600_04210 [Streptosporangium carneum]